MRYLASLGFGFGSGLIIRNCFAVEPVDIGRLAIMVLLFSISAALIGIMNRMGCEG